MSEFVLKRSMLADFSEEYVNLYADGKVIYRSVHTFGPEKDIRKSITSISLVERLSKRLEQEKEFTYQAESVVDGVMYEVRFYGKTWFLFCPDLSRDKRVQELGKLIEETVEELCKN